MIGKFPCTAHWSLISPLGAQPRWEILKSLLNELQNFLPKRCTSSWLPLAKGFPVGCNPQPCPDDACLSTMKFLSQGRKHNICGRALVDTIRLNYTKPYVSELIREKDGQRVWEGAQEVVEFVSGLFSLTKVLPLHKPPLWNDEGSRKSLN